MKKPDKTLVFLEFLAYFDADFFVKII